MKHIYISAALLLAVMLAFISAEIYYITPTASTSCTEKGVPCFTISDYAKKPNNYFASNTTLILLRGNHTLDSEFSIDNETIDALLVFSENDTIHSDTSVKCSQSARFTVKDIRVVSMRGLVLVGCMNNNITSVEQLTVKECSLQGQGSNGTGLELNWITSASVVRSSFSFYTGEEIWDWGERVGGAIIIVNSTVIILNSTFNNNLASGFYTNVSGLGGAVYAVSSIVTLNDNTFNNNTVTGEHRRCMGGAVSVVASTLIMNSNKLNSNTVTGNFGIGGAVYAESSTVIMNSNEFKNNNVIGEYRGWGGAVWAFLSRVTMSRNAFNNNTVTANYGSGGAVWATLSNVTVKKNAFNNNAVTGDYGSGGAVYTWSNNVIMNSNIFNKNTVIGNNGLGGAVNAESSNVTMNNNVYNNHNVTGDSGEGGAVSARRSTVTMNSNTFNNNTVTGEHNAWGGAVSTASSMVIINSNTFNDNTVTASVGIGGAMYAEISIMTIYSNTFNNNTVSGELRGWGGAVWAVFSHMTMNWNTFKNNTVTGDYGCGGAVYAWCSNVTTNGNTFNNNTATLYGAAVYFEAANVISTGFLDIQNNMAAIGGALYVSKSKMHFSGNTTISNNYGSLYAYASNVTFSEHTNIMNNSYSTNTSQEGGAVTGIQSEIVFTGAVNLSYNTAIHGGAISATQSKVYVYGNITIAQNTASLSGGGIYAYQSEFNLENYINIFNNSAVEEGGGIHVISSVTRMTDNSKTYFVGNNAKRGGGACLEMNSKLYIIKTQGAPYIREETWIRLQFTENSAVYGGALFINDNTNSGTCHTIPFSSESTISSECFLHGLTFQSYNVHDSAYADIITSLRNTYFTNNSATEVGHEIYGGLLDRCTVNPYAEIFFKDYNLTFSQSLSAVSYIFHITNLSIQDFNDSSKIISSDPVRVCFCRDDQRDCSYYPQPVYVKKGEIFIISLIAVDQINNTISSTIIHGSVPLPAGLGEEQSAQKTNENGSCTELKYSILTPRNSEVLSLYAKGPCMGIGISTVNLTVYIEPCPVGFKDNNQRCDCDRVLVNKYVSNCSIDDQTVLRRDNVWFSYANTTDHPHSYILHKHCPFDYCFPSTQIVHVNLSIPNGADTMCAFNRTSKLCGSCRDGLSLSLGSSRCMQCSNNWLALLILFAITGVALVAFILVCNLTVTAGTINGLLFYVNIASSNQATYFPNSINKFFTIFISWLNLDFGFETCFFNGLNGYWKTWLQLAFPAYVILLVILVIKACEYSPRFARLIARKNPVATLDTLVLLSYTKFIRTIISAWQFAILEYSDGTYELVWLVDANIRYFELKHIPLFIAALVILIAALTYTLLLFLWQWLLLCPNRQPVKWIRNSRLHGIMGAYFISFNKNHRYWTGLLLLARAILYLVSALNGMQTNDPRMNLLAVILVVGSLVIWKDIIKGKIYRKWPLNILDTSFLFNLLTLTALTFYVIDVGGNQTAVASISVSIAFITFILIISYHIYAFVLNNQVEKIKKIKLHIKNLRGDETQSQQNIGSDTENHDDAYVTVTVVDVPLIPLDHEGNEKPDGFDTDEDNVSSDIDTTESNHSTSKTRAEGNQPQVELEDFAATNEISDEDILNMGHIVYKEENDASSATTDDYHCTTSNTEIATMDYFTANNDDPDMNEHSGEEEPEEGDNDYDEQTPLLSCEV